MKSEEYLDFDSESSSDDDTVTELKREVTRVEKEIKSLKTGWSDVSEEVTGLRILLKERTKKLEDLKTKEEQGVTNLRSLLIESEEELEDWKKKAKAADDEVTNLQNELRKEKERNEMLDKMREANF